MKITITSKSDRPDGTVETIETVVFADPEGFEPNWERDYPRIVTITDGSRIVIFDEDGPTIDNQETVEFPTMWFDNDGNIVDEDKGD